jgi:hypothetical protein
MMRRTCAVVFAVIFTLVACRPARARGDEMNAIVCAKDASPMETLAAREVRRYFYLRTGYLLPITQAMHVPDIVVARKDRPLAKGAGADVAGLKPQEYLLKRVGGTLYLVGGDDAGTLYAAYRFAEHLGVRFELHGDIVPDGHFFPDFRLFLNLNECGSPLFALRGIQPFHDFAEGPDWWNADDYKSYIAQLPKMRMNFIGLHTYPEGIAEPTVWIGQSSDIGPGGTVRFAYPASYQNTMRGDWGYGVKKTGDFLFGAAQMFDRDDYGADVMRGLTPKPQKPEECDTLFDRTGVLLRDAFTWAHRLGVKTCVGTETPLTVPQAVQARLRAEGKDPASPAVVQELYAGIFRRIMAAYPVDYYWFWTPEGWTWSGTTQEQVQATLRDLAAAFAAAKQAGATFQLATCGWVLGPPGDRALFDRFLPPGTPVSCINRQVGNEPVEPGFADVKRRPKWAIPWLEDDPGLTQPQLWAGRMRRDAADARKYGCTGLMGIHWRTRVLGPNVSALAQAAWDQSFAKSRQPFVSGPVGGNIAAFPGAPITDTGNPELYRTVRYDMSAYRLAVPNGTCKVTLKFCEPHYDRAGVRVFDVKLQGKTVIENLDIFARVGKNRALDYAFDDVRVTNGRLDIDFVHRVEFPCIAAIAVEGRGYSKKINCGGPVYKDYAADPAPAPRGLPVGDFYLDWARANFGSEAAARIAVLFVKVDGRLPRPADWIDGPGGLRPDPRPWEEARKDYVFVDEMTALRPRVRGRGSMERFDYWLNTFRYLRGLARIKCAWGAFEREMAKVRAETNPEAKAQLARETALPARVELVRRVGETWGYLLATVSTPGEMGTVANLEQHSLPALLTRPGEELAQALGEPLPAEAIPSQTYDGPARLIVPTVRTTLAAGEPLHLKAMALSGSPPREVVLFWRPMGKGEYRRVPFSHVARGVYSVSLPPEAARGAGLEWYVRAVMENGETALFPATAPERAQTVTVMPGGPGR